MKIFITTENFLYEEEFNTFYIYETIDFVYINKYISVFSKINNIYQNIKPLLKWYIDEYQLPKNLVSILRQHL